MPNPKEPGMHSLLRAGEWDGVHLPVTMEKCHVFQGEGRYEAMADLLSSHYQRPDRKKGWTRILEVSRWKDNYISSFCEIKKAGEAPEWWLMLGHPEEERLRLNLVLVAPPVEPNLSPSFFDFLVKINEEIGKRIHQVPRDSITEAVRWTNHLIKEMVGSLNSKSNRDAPESENKE